MKKIYLLISVCVISINLFGQYNLGDELLFPEFQEGVIKFNNNTQQKAVFNYNTIDKEFLFLQDDKTIMALANPEYVDTIIIANRYFVPAGKGEFYELIRPGKTNLYIQWKSRYISQGKGAGYGSYSSTGAIDNVSTVHNMGGGSLGAGTNVYSRLSSDEKFKANTDCIYYLKIDNKYKKFVTLKNLTSLFKSQKDNIETYAKENKTDFANPEEVYALLEYIYSL